MVDISYNLWLIGLSIAVTFVGCFACLSLAWRLPELKGYRLRINLACIATMLGATIWAAHFISMLAWDFPFLVAYDIQLTLVSLLISVIVVGVALYVVASDVRSNAKMAIGGVTLGCGFSLMHFLGMEAFQSGFCIVAYDSDWIILSVLFSISIACLSVWLVFRNNYRLHIEFGALLLTASVCGMHYFAMLASNFVIGDAEVSIPAPILPSQTMAIVVSLVIFGIIASSLLVAVPDQPRVRSDGRDPGPDEPMTDATLSDRLAPGQEVHRVQQRETLPVVQENRTIFLGLDEIVFIKADAHYSSVHATDRTYFCQLSLSNLESRLPRGSFLRVHRSFIVNVGKVEGFEQTRDQGKLLFDREGKQSVPVSRRRFREMHKVFGT